MSGAFDQQADGATSSATLRNIEAEIGLLGDLIANNRLIDEVADRCRPNDFSVPLYGRVYGRSYGAVRNFCRYQRPKKPNSTYPQTLAVRNWVGTEARSTRDGSEPDTGSSDNGSEAPKPSAPSSGEPVGNQLPTSGEKCRQMEEEGGRSSSVANATGVPPPVLNDPSKILFDAGVALLVRSGVSDRQARGLVAKWRKAQGEPWTREALVSAEGKADPVSWIEARAKPWREPIELHVRLTGGRGGQAEAGNTRTGLGADAVDHARRRAPR